MKMMVERPGPQARPQARQAALRRGVAGWLALWLAAAPPVQAHGASEASSALSMLPVALSVAAPVGLLSAGAVFTVLAVQASAEGTVWLLQRASDGARLSVTVAAGTSVVAGQALLLSAVAGGWVLSQAGRVLLFIPNEIGVALMHHERLTP